MTRSIVLFLTGIAAGLTAGWLAFASSVTTPPAAPEPPAPAAPSAPAPSPAAAAPSVMRDRTPAGVRFVPAAPQVRGSIPAGCEPIAKETETLRTRVAELETKLEQFQKERTLAEGTPLAKPAALPERFNDAALRENVTKALKEAGIPGDVTSVDCTEYPCIVYGKAGKRGDMDKLEATASMKGYGADHHSTHEWGVGSKQPDGTSKDELYFGMALYPKVDGETEAQRDEITKRLQVRQQEMWEAMRPRSGK